MLNFYDRLVCMNKKIGHRFFTSFFSFGKKEKIFWKRFVVSSFISAFLSVDACLWLFGSLLMRCRTFIIYSWFQAEAVNCRWQFCHSGYKLKNKDVFSFGFWSLGGRVVVTLRCTWLLALSHKLWLPTTPNSKMSQTKLMQLTRKRNFYIRIRARRRLHECVCKNKHTKMVVWLIQRPFRFLSYEKQNLMVIPFCVKPLDSGKDWLIYSMPTPFWCYSVQNTSTFHSAKSRLAARLRRCEQLLLFIKTSYELKLITQRGAHELRG